MIAFSDLRTAAYCPRKLYYARRHDREPPAAVAERRSLAVRYGELVDAPDAAFAGLPTDVPPERYRRNLRRARDRFDDWQAIADPPRRDVRLSGKDCRGVAHKVIEDPPRPSLVSPGSPPEEGVWHPHAVHAVAAAKALAWERERPVETALVQYPAYGTVREVRLTTRKKAAYRRTLRAVESLDGPPPRLENRDKCNPCEYSDECGVSTRTLRSLLS